jgi:hypothetical protein
MFLEADLARFKWLGGKPKLLERGPETRASRQRLIAVGIETTGDTQMALTGLFEGVQPKVCPLGITYSY